MSRQFDLKKEWENTKKQLQQFSREAIVLAHKGEEELVKFSRKGKLHLDSTAIGLKMEHLYHLIGKEYVKTRHAAKVSSKLEKLIEELTKLEKEHHALKVKIRRGSEDRAKK
jgi:hypothetical protein